MAAPRFPSPASPGVPIKYIGTGERSDALEQFHPDRMASRILAMGDVMTLIERAQEAVDEDKARELERKMRTASFTLDDFLDQIQGVKKMGGLSSVLEMMPGLGRQTKKMQEQLDESELRKTEAIIRSMTLHERANPEIIKGSRRRRIALGSGTNPSGRQPRAKPVQADPAVDAAVLQQPEGA